MKYGNLTLGQIEAAINKLGGEEGFALLLQDKLVITKKDEQPVSSAEICYQRTLAWGRTTPPKFLMTVTLGRRKTVQEHIAALKECGHTFGDCLDEERASEIVLTYGQEEEEWDLFVASSSDMGFTEESCLSAIYSRALSLGWEVEKLPTEAGFVICESYNGQKPRQWLNIATESFRVSRCFESIFKVECDSDGHVKLNLELGYPERACHRTGTLWVFGRRRKNQ